MAMLGMCVSHKLSSKVRDIHIRELGGHAILLRDEIAAEEKGV